MTNFDRLRESVFAGTREAKEDAETHMFGEVLDLALERCANIIGSGELEDAPTVANLAAYCEHVLVLAKEAHAVRTIDPAGPSANAIIVFPNTDTDGWDAFYAFEEDPANYLIGLLRERNYDPMHDPFADHRSIQAEYEGSLYDADQLTNFGGFLGLPITFLPDVSPS